MFTLQRNGDFFEICEEASLGGEVKAPATPTRRILPECTASQRVGYDQWKLFVDKGKWQGPRPQDAVAASWMRCRAMQVDPSPRSCGDIVSMDELEPFVSVWQETAREVEHKTCQAIRGKDLLLTVADAKGRIVRTCGDLPALQAADRLKFGPGANWTEMSVGTNAIGTALSSGVPMQVFGEEHFCESHHAWNCSGAPIFDPQGAVWACIDISGPVGADHALAFDLVIGAARALERQLFQAYLADIENKSRSMFAAVFNAVLTGVLTVDASGHITNANGAAEALLGLPGKSLRGRRADAFLDYRQVLAARAKAPNQTEAVTIACHTNPRLIARAAPVLAPGGTWCHTIITISEPQRLRPPQPVAAKSAGVPTKGSDKGFAAILSRGPAMAGALRKARQAARTPSTVLLTGESGTGKELFARGIHEASDRANGPFVAVNCGALARELAQSELFGYKAGAFTGADNKGRIGKFEQADKGTLFLDEISEMPLELQVNLLRPLEERCVVRVGGLRTHPVDVKVIAATNRDLSKLVASGRFREDLFFRINVVRIQIPPLRERGKEDIRLLAEAHARRLCASFGLPFIAIDPAALRVLYAHNWPGNVRELLNCVEYAVNAMEDGHILPEHLPLSLDQLRRPAAEPETTGSGSFRLESLEVITIREALSHHGGNVSQAARALGIGRNTLYAKMRKFGIL